MIHLRKSTISRLVAASIALSFGAKLQSAEAADEVAWLIPSDSRSDPIRVAPVQFLIERLPNYHHHIVDVTSARAGYELSHTPGTCTVGIARTPERIGSLLFTERSILTSGFRVIVRKGNQSNIARYLNASGEVELSGLSENKTLRGGYVTSKPAPAFIEEFIKKLVQENMIYKVNSVGPLLNTLNSGRVDYVFLSYADLISYERNNVAPNDFASYPIAGVKRTSELYVVYSLGPLGARVVTDINKLFADERSYRAFLEPLMPLLDPLDRTQAPLR